MFLPILRKINEIVHIRKLKKVFKSLSFNFGGKFLNALPVHNSKQIIEETLINDISFFVSKKDLRFSPKQKKRLTD